jgi:DNA-binding NarL/FixJ family response regulator
MPLIRVAIVEDDVRCSRAFMAALSQADDMQWVGTAVDVHDGRHLLDRTRPDVLLVDLGLPGGSGIDVIRHARCHLPACEVMVVTVFGDEAHVVASIEAGATGYLLKDADAAVLVAQIRTLCAGGSPISPMIARRLLTRLAPAGDPAPEAPAPAASTRLVPPLLSAQETEVLRLVARGFSHDEVARVMGVAHHTVQTYVKRAYRKLQVHSKTEAVYEARAHGWLPE